MSSVTGIVIHAREQDDCDDNKFLAQANRWLDARSEDQWWAISRLDEYAAGGKSPQYDLYGGGLNHFEKYHDDFIKFVFDYPWELPNQVVLIMGTEACKTYVYTKAGCMVSDEY